jgi:enoyl-CoA hydratase/carnithine racemase
MTVKVKRPSAHVAEVIMNRPEALNALSTDQVGDSVSVTSACNG